MAELNTGGDQGGSKKRAKKQSTRVDMTPLVDLAFLLLTFFVLTSTFSKPKVLRMIFPEKLKNDQNVKQPEVKNGLTLLLTENNRIFYYKGSCDAKTVLQESGYTKEGLRQLLMDENLPLIKELKKLQTDLDKYPEVDTLHRNKIMAQVRDAQSKASLVVLVKADEKATYRNMIDVMDELLITQVAKYFPVDEGFNAVEKKLVSAKIKM